MLPFELIAQTENLIEEHKRMGIAIAETNNAETRIKFVLLPNWLRLTRRLIGDCKRLCSQGQGLHSHLLFELTSASSEAEKALVPRTQRSELSEASALRTLDNQTNVYHKT